MSAENSSEGSIVDLITSQDSYQPSDGFSNDIAEGSSVQSSSPLLGMTPSAQDQSSLSEESEPSTTQSFEYEAADSILRKIRLKNVNRVIVGTLNINSLAPKFELLKEIIGKNIDILTIQETKLDSRLPSAQFLINGYSEPCRLDRDRNGGGSDDLCEGGHSKQIVD